MQTVSLCDLISVAPAPRLSFNCDDRALAGDDNLVLRAARALQERAIDRPGALLSLRKAIPVGAGLGGGSSDAAATLLALRHLWGVTMPDEEMSWLAASLGSDVPFFLSGGLALVHGRGERVIPLSAAPTAWLAIVYPGIEVSTARVYRALGSEDWTDGSVTKQLADDILSGSSLRLGINGLQSTLFRLYEEAHRCYETVSALSSSGALVSGSGSAVFALCETEEEARTLAVEAHASGYWAAAARTMDMEKEG
jgi:4-diphosphocytidyl-2-C-methyl-D-erythritol kinase